MTENLLVVMAKAPVAGEVKTRLTPPLPPDDAARLAECFLEDRLIEMGKLKGCERAIAFTPPNTKRLFEQYSAGRYSLFPQRGQDLGQRMHNIFVDKHSKGYGAIVIVGSDSPDLPRSILGDAFDRLRSKSTDVVLGPAADGGYYLIGMKQPHPQLFEKISWGTKSVLSATLESARKSAIRTECLQVWHDIDTIADIQRFYNQYRSKPMPEHQPGANTLACLVDMKENLPLFSDHPG